MPARAVMRGVVRGILDVHACAGVVKLADARDSKSRGVHAPCRFDSDLRHQIHTRSIFAPLANSRAAMSPRLPFSESQVSRSDRAGISPTVSGRFPLSARYRGPGVISLTNRRLIHRADWR